jgi:hypothetical protein
MGAPNGGPGADNYNAAYAEVVRRQTIAQLEASAAQKGAANATKETARHTRRTATFMLWSVFAIAAGAIITAAASIWSTLHACH